GAADVGHTLRVQITVTSGAGATLAWSAATGVVVAASPYATAVPGESGTAKAGSVLTASGNGSWAGAPSSYSYRWRRCGSAGYGCVDIGGATSSSYTLTDADVGSTIRLAVTATATGASATASSPASGVVSAAPPPPPPAPPSPG